ncbi:MAG: hypothetical protein HC858_07145 [Brachymonas sp.]|nr:hypothetical protein [Brachymonas sp.]
MNRTQIQLPDQLYQRAKLWAEVNECSLAELTRRGLESYLDRYPVPQAAVQTLADSSRQSRAAQNSFGRFA